MRTTVEIDDDLWNRATQAVPTTTKRALIEQGLRALVDRAARQRAITLAGSMPDIEVPSRTRFRGKQK
jgi:Arc/MetJ family transcription regulator